MLPSSAVPNSKRCPGCDQELPIDAFYINNARPDGRSLRCKACDLAYKKSLRATMMARTDFTLDETATKRCPRCGETLPLTAFARDRGRRDGASMYCKPCSAIRAKEFRAANPDKMQASKRKSYAKQYRTTGRAALLRNRFGLTIAQYDALLEAQGGVCGICGRKPAAHERKQDLCVDHDHGTGQIRGLLCGECNSALGLFRDSPALLRQAIAYLAKHGTTE